MSISCAQAVWSVRGISHPRTCPLFSNEHSRASCRSLLKSGANSLPPFFVSRHKEPKIGQSQEPFGPGIGKLLLVAITLAGLDLLGRIAQFGEISLHGAE